MIFTNVIGRVGKDAEVKNGQKGDFMFMDIAVDDFVKGEQKTTWIRIKSSRPNHINLAQHLKKGRMLHVLGTLAAPEIYKDKQNVEHVQLSIIASSINFVVAGKKKEPVEDSNVPTPPADAPEVKEDLPF